MQALYLFLYKVWRRVMYFALRRMHKLSQHLHTVEFKVGGKSIRYRYTDDWVAESQFKEYDNWETSEIEFFVAVAPVTQVFLDVGTNTGYYTILTALHNPEAEIHCFEPIQANINRFRENLQLNGLDQDSRIHLHPQAVGSRVDRIPFYVRQDDNIADTASAHKSLTENYKHYHQVEIKEVEVDLITLDSIRDQFSKRVDLIKIDVEFFEYDVLLGARQLIAEHKPAVMVEVHVFDIYNEFKNYDNIQLDLDPEHADKIMQFFQEQGYHAYAIFRHYITKGMVRVQSLDDSGFGVINYLFSPIKTDKRCINFQDKATLRQLLQYPG